MDDLVKLIYFAKKYTGAIDYVHRDHGSRVRIVNEIIIDLDDKT